MKTCKEVDIDSDLNIKWPGKSPDLTPYSFKVKFTALNVMIIMS